MMILAIECSSARRSVALAIQGEAPIERSQAAAPPRSGPASQSVALMAMIEDALSAANRPRDRIRTVAVGLGPGSYTGIRGAIAVALGWELATGCLTLGIPSSSACARRARIQGIRGRAAVVIDAQRGEFYVEEWNLEEDAESRVGEMRLAARVEVEDLSRSGAQLIGPDVAGFPGGRLVFPDATAIAEWAMASPPGISQPLEPIYLRPTAFVRAPAPRVIA